MGCLFPVLVDKTEGGEASSDDLVSEGADTFFVVGADQNDVVVSGGEGDLLGCDAIGFAVDLDFCGGGGFDQKSALGGGSGFDAVDFDAKVRMEGKGDGIFKDFVVVVGDDFEFVGAGGVEFFEDDRVVFGDLSAQSFVEEDFGTDLFFAGFAGDGETGGGAFEFCDTFDAGVSLEGEGFFPDGVSLFGDFDELFFFGVDAVFVWGGFGEFVSIDENSGLGGIAFDLDEGPEGLEGEGLGEFAAWGYLEFSFKGFVFGSCDLEDAFAGFLDLDQDAARADAFDLLGWDLLVVEKEAGVLDLFGEAEGDAGGFFGLGIGFDFREEEVVKSGSAEATDQQGRK